MVPSRHWTPGECRSHALTGQVECAVRHSQWGKPQPGEGTGDILEGGHGNDEQSAGRERQIGRTKEVSMGQKRKYDMRQAKPD